MSYYYVSDPIYILQIMHQFCKYHCFDTEAKIKAQRG